MKLLIFQNSNVFKNKTGMFDNNDSDQDLLNELPNIDNNSVKRSRSNSNENL